MYSKHQTPYLVGKHLTTADIALYAYTHVSDEGGGDFSAYPAIQAWLARIEAHDDYQLMN